MKWFEGTIKEAIDAAKQNNCFFAVYVEGNDKLSKIMTAVMNSGDISSILESNKFVSIKIQEGSDEYQNFIKIYKHVPVPSLFLIGMNGVPIAIINNLSDEDKQTLRQHVLKAISKEKEMVNDGASCGSGAVSCNVICSNENITKVRNSDFNENEGQPLPLSVNEDNLRKTVSAEPVTDTEPTEIHTKQLDATNKLTSGDSHHKRQREDAKEEEDKVKKRAIEINPAEAQKILKYEEDRRRIQEIQQKRIQNDLDRQRILKDIALDKEERLANQQYLSSIHQNNINNEESGLRPRGTPSRSYSRDETQIQFRMPNGMTFTKEFNVKSVINDLRIYVVNNIPIDYSQFDLAIAFPCHIFTAEENNKTLEELELIPNAVILILPIANNHSGVSYLYTSISTSFWYCASSTMSFFRYVHQSVHRAIPVSLVSLQPTPASSQQDGHSAQNRNHSGRVPISNSLQNVRTIADINDNDDDENMSDEN